MSNNDSAEDLYIDDIAPDVMRVLEKLHFFEKLDDYFCPVADSERRVPCLVGSFDISNRILCDLGMSPEDIEEVIAVLHSKGACCDCEVLYNVAKRAA